MPVANKNRARSVLRDVRISPKKMRPVADLVRGLPVERAVEVLRFTTLKGAQLILKVLNSAIANAENNYGLDIDELKVAEIFIDKGLVMKRVMPRARGRSDRIIKRSSHITVSVAEK